MIGCLFVFIALALFLVASALLRGWVLTYLWQWFAVPFGLPELGLAHAIGVSVLVSFLTYEYTGLLVDTSDEKRYSAAGTAFFMPLFALLIGYIVHLYM